MIIPVQGRNDYISWYTPWGWYQKHSGQIRHFWFQTFWNGLLRGWPYGVHCLWLRMYWEIPPPQTFKPFGSIRISGHEKYQTRVTQILERAIAQECERDGGEKDEDGVFARCWSVGQLLALPESSSGQSQGCAAHADLPLPINARGQLIWTLHTVEVNRGSSAQNHRSQFFKCYHCYSLGIWKCLTCASNKITLRQGGDMKWLLYEMQGKTNEDGCNFTRAESARRRRLTMAA